MPTWVCTNECFFGLAKSMQRFWYVGDEVVADAEDMPQDKQGNVNHFVKKGSVGHKIFEDESKKLEDDFNKGNLGFGEDPIPKSINHMKKAELIEYGAKIGLELPEEETNDKMREKIRAKINQ